MMRDEDNRQTNRLGRYAVVTDKTITTPAAAKARTAAELQARLGDPDITELEVADHSHAPLGSYDVGDDIFIETGKGWYGQLEVWVKILAITIRPHEQTTTLTVRRVEKVN